MNLRPTGVLAKLLAFVAAGLLPLAAYAQVVTGAFTPSAVGSNTPSTLTLNYSGFTSNSVGMVLRVYYDSTKVTPGTATYSSPPGQSQPPNSPTAGTLAGCTGANTFIALNWVDFGSTWPTPTSGQLATVPFTSANPFTSNALVCWVDDTSGGTPVRNITGNAVLQFTVAPAVSIAAAPASINDALTNNVSTITVTSTQAAATGGLTVNLTPPAVNARYSTTCGSTITITAGNTTATCTVTATNNTVVGDGNVNAPVTIAAGAGYTITGTNPAVVTIVDDDVPVISAVCTPATLTDSAGQTSTCTIRSDKALVTPLTVNLTPPVANARYTTTCVGTISIPAGAAGTSNTCTISAVANTTMGDGNVTASLTVAAGTGYSVGGSTQNVAVNNDDFVSVVTTTPTITEGGNAVFTLSCPGVATVTVNYSFSGTYSPLPATGSQSLTCGTPLLVTVPTLDDAVLNGTRTLTLTITSVGPPGAVNPANAAATVTVLDNDVPLAPTIIPTMNTLGLLLLGLLLAAAAGFGIRRKA